MDENNLVGMSNEELLKRKTVLSIGTGMLAAMLIGMLGYSMYTSTEGRSNMMLVIPLGLSPIVIMGCSRINKIKQELRSRRNP